jgi:hypothetical protein
VKIVDFGVAKADVQGAATSAGLVKGKVSYMSPEQCRGEVVDRRTDVFALGIVLYELTTGMMLFQGEHDAGIVERILGDTPIDPPSERRADYPRNLEALILRMLERDRERRPATAREVQLELERIVREEGYTTSAQSTAAFLGEIFGTPAAHERPTSAATSGLSDAFEIEILDANGEPLDPGELAAAARSPLVTKAEGALARRLAGVTREVSRRALVATALTVVLAGGMLAWKLLAPRATAPAISAATAPAMPPTPPTTPTTTTPTPRAIATRARVPDPQLPSRDPLAPPPGIALEIDREASKKRTGPSRVARARTKAPWDRDSPLPP